MQTSDFFSSPSLYSRLMFAFVIQIGVARNDGTLRTPLFVVPFVFGLLPLSSATASVAAPLASTLAGL